MERFTDKNMTESQITEIVELMDGEHAEALELWGARNRNQGEGTGMVAGVLMTLLVAGCTKLTVDLAKATWELGKAFVETVNEKLNP